MKTACILPAIACAMLLMPGMPAAARNQPCSGQKGGISHCMGQHFVCNDGSISASKQVCDGHGPAASARQKLRGASGGSDCACRSGHICTGPRGGRYCLNDSGGKSYLRR